MGCMSIISVSRYTFLQKLNGFGIIFHVASNGNEGLMRKLIDFLFGNNAYLVIRNADFGLTDPFDVLELSIVLGQTFRD